MNKKRQYPNFSACPKPVHDILVS